MTAHIYKRFISTHTLTWSVTLDCCKRWIAWNISTHTLTWSVTQNLWKLQKSTEFQLTRSRGAWPVNSPFCRIYLFISTHTLTWSVTSSAGNMTYGKIISTHTLTWSVTGWRRKRRNWMQISTHTLTWSVTSEFDIILIWALFQLTRSRGAWRTENMGCVNMVYFNSHAHVERDSLSGIPADRIAISTHTLTWSVTQRHTSSRKMIEISTHTLTWSVTSKAPDAKSREEISTHTLTWSVTVCLYFEL